MKGNIREDTSSLFAVTRIKEEGHVAQHLKILLNGDDGIQMKNDRWKASQTKCNPWRISKRVWLEGAMAALRAPSAVVIAVATVFFLLYLLPWQSLPSIQIPSPSPASFAWKYSAFTPDGPRKLQQEWSLRAADLDLLNTNVVPTGMVTYRAIRDAGIVFNASGSDVLVILHIQKTGGTSFEKHIVQDLDVEKPCICWKRRKRCKCPRPTFSKTSNSQFSRSCSIQVPSLLFIKYLWFSTTGNSLESRKENVDSWLFSRFSTGWICGLHADWTELTSCVDEELRRAHGSATRRRYSYFSNF